MIITRPVALTLRVPERAYHMGWVAPRPLVIHLKHGKKPKAAPHFHATSTDQLLDRRLLGDTGLPSESGKRTHFIVSSRLFCLSYPAAYFP